MKTQKTFETIVRGMTIKEIVQAMIDGLRKPKIKVDMWTFGEVLYENSEKGVCFGCAATNTICQISGKVFSAQNIGSVFERANFINSNKNFLHHFEQAINDLRCCCLIDYNLAASKIGISIIPEEKLYNQTRNNLPYLNTDYNKEDLDEWQKFADTL